jgi:hypothetical protein
MWHNLWAVKTPKSAEKTAKGGQMLENKTYFTASKKSKAAEVLLFLAVLIVLANVMLAARRHAQEAKGQAQPHRDWMHWVNK